MLITAPRQPDVLAPVFAATKQFKHKYRAISASRLFYRSYINAALAILVSRARNGKPEGHRNNFTNASRVYDLSSAARDEWEVAGRIADINNATDNSDL